MKQITICLVILLAAVTVCAQDLVKEDYTQELGQCLIYHAYKHISLEHLDYAGNDEDDDGVDDIVTLIMNTCYPIHVLQVRAHAYNMEIAVEMMHSEGVENAYEELAEATVKIVTEQLNKTEGSSL